MSGAAAGWLLSDSGQNSVSKIYYRYWEGTFHAVDNPGHPHAIQYIVGYEGTRAYDWLDDTFDDDFLTASKESLNPYASAYFEYDSEHRIVKTWSDGACGCGSASDGVTTFTYEDNVNYTDNTSTYQYDQTSNDKDYWMGRTIIKRPGGTYVTQYYDEVGQSLHRVVTNAIPSGSPTKTWATKVVRNGDGQVTTVHSPANVTAYTHSSEPSFTTSSMRSNEQWKLPPAYLTVDMTEAERLDLRDALANERIALKREESPDTEAQQLLTTVRAMPTVASALANLETNLGLVEGAWDAAVAPAP